MTSWKNICNRFSQSERDLQLKLLRNTGQARKRLYMKRDEIDQRADSRCPPGRAGGIKAR
jgi:hypothetical protein